MSEFDRSGHPIDSVTIPTAMIQSARDGESSSSVGRLLELYRNYLTLLAQAHVNRRIRVRADASDVVQETFLEAHRDFQDFRGNTEKELIGWLRKILVRNLLDQARMQRAEKRDVNRVQSLDAAMEHSSHVLGAALLAETPTPSEQLNRRERAVMVADAIARLSEDQRFVIIQRQIQQRTFQEVAEEMNKSPGAVRMIWLRGLERLRRNMKDQLK